MKTSALASFRIALPLLAGLAAAPGAWAAVSYLPEKQIPIAGEGGWDYLTVDPAQHRLYVSHATKVVVIDTRTDEIVGEIADTPGVHGVALAPALNRGFTSNGRENKVSVFDPATLATVTKVATGTNPDAILFATATKEVYAFNGRSHSATVIDAAGAKVVATVPLDGKPEFAQEEPASGRIFVNLEDKSEVAVIDAKTRTVTARWPLAPGEEPSGMAIDLAHHRLFVGCANSKLVVLDTTDGRVVAVLPAGAGIDAAAFDPGRQLAFTSNGRDGTVTIVHEDGPDRFSVVATLPTERSARTMIVDPVTHRLYLVAARFDPAENGARPKIVPGTVRVLVFAPAE